MSSTNDHDRIRIGSVSVREHQERTGLRWGVHYRVYLTGTAKPKYKAHFFATSEDAHAFKAVLLRPDDADGTTPVAAARVTDGSVAAYLKEWLKFVKSRRSGATYRSYETMTRLFIVPAAMGPTTFGALPMASLKPLVVRRMYDVLFANGVKIGTRKQVHRTLSAACLMAVMDEVLDHNPCLVLGRVLRHKTEAHLDPVPHPMTAPEMDAFMKYVKRYEPEWVEYFQFLFDTGVRVGEAAAIKWDTVDLKNKTATIESSWSPTERAEKAPKTAASKRQIDLTDLVVQQLTDLRKRQRVEALRRGLSPRLHVFTVKSGAPRRQDGTMPTVFHRVCRAIKVTGKKPHSCRDTFATLHLSADWTILPWVSRQLGHESENTTVDHYFKYTPTAASKEYANRIRSAR